MFFSEELTNSHNNNNQNGNNKHIKNNKNKEYKNELLIFGYSCNIFRDDKTAERLEKYNGDLLIPWHDDEDYSLYLDRYDVRNLIEDKNSLEKMEHYKNELNNDEIIYDEERYMDLDSEEEKLNEMSEDEREIYLEIKREKKIKKEMEKEEENEEVNTDESTDIEEPDTEQQKKIIEKTAKFITESSNSQIEIIIQAKQSSNPLFNFLNKNDILYPYYQRTCLLMKMGIYSYSEDKTTNNDKKNNNIRNDINNNSMDTKSSNNSSIDENKSKDDKNQYHSKNSNNDTNRENLEYSELEKRIPENTKLIIEKMADYIARNGNEFETLVRQKNIGNEKFSFMQPWNEFYNYYKYKIDKCLMLNKINRSENSNDKNDDNNNNIKNEALYKNNNYNEDKSILEEKLSCISDESKSTKNNEDIKAKRLLKMKEILAKKKLKKN
ncbi:hypothetical protein BCR36DRAFT_581440 [Piromyces finnis]|uniref:SURP motif domain-containing protein n=1 Tax=Piromyces finnis TaxID=1754191 RepID=A0A1Y1VH01_9FUNG|nr:hypothetical protein BCR36DRAFT_581440 [Piromyces finnis]|eukprot:ORX55420.1 hypothetical protein BCR36DRAFT_581440 [Piromyces finnis]